jgi:hypothetical protein
VKRVNYRVQSCRASKIKKSPHLENLKILYDILLTRGERFHEDGRLYAKEFLEDGVKIRSRHRDREFSPFRMRGPGKRQENLG